MLCFAKWPALSANGLCDQFQAAPYHYEHCSDYIQKKSRFIIYYTNTLELNLLGILRRNLNDRGRD